VQKSVRQNLGVSLLSKQKKQAKEIFILASRQRRISQRSLWLILKTNSRERWEKAKKCTWKRT